MYYAGNILYDLFLKKEKAIYKEETEEFSLSAISEQYEDLTATIGIEDVENLNTPRSFNKNQIHPDFIDEERQDLEYLRERFESEQDLDELDNAPKKDSTENENLKNSENSESSETYPNQKEKVSKEQEIQKPYDVIPQSPIIKDKATENSRIKEWKKMLNLSETLVQMVANYDGHKVYHSTM